MGRNWNNKIDRKDMLERAKHILDCALSKGEVLSSDDMYGIIQAEIGFDEIGIDSPSRFEIIEHEGLIRQAKRTIVSETMRWIKVQIIRQNLKIEDYLYEEKVGRKWKYRYKLPSFSVFRNLQSKRNPVENLVFLLHNISHNESSKTKVNLTVESLPIEYYNIEDNYKVRQQQLEQIYNKEIDDAVNRNYSLILLYGLETDDSNNKIREIVSNNLNFFRNNRIGTYYELFLWIAACLDVFDITERRVFATEFSSRVEFILDERMDCYLGYNEIAYFLIILASELDIENDISHLKNAIYILEKLYGEQKNQDYKTYILLICAYHFMAISTYYNPNGSNLELTILYGKKAISIIDNSNFQFNYFSLSIIEYMYLAFKDGLNDCKSAQAVLKFGIDKVKNVDKELRTDLELELNNFLNLIS